MTPSVYLCGPIDNVTPTGASNWRDRATDLIGDRAEVVDPFREFPEWPVEIERKRELREWCFEQSRECDVVLVGNLDPTVVTRGSAMEIREAELAGTPIVVQSGRIAELSNNVLVPASGLHTDIEAAVANALAIVGVREVSV